MFELLVHIYVLDKGQSSYFKYFRMHHSGLLCWLDLFNFSEVLTITTRNGNDRSDKIALIQMYNSKSISKIYS